MKRIFFITAILLSTSVLYAQKDSIFYKHEVKVSCGGAILPSLFWNLFCGIDGVFYVNVSASYLYRPVKWFWIGGNFVNYIGNRIDYNWREYDVNGNYRDFSKSKLKYCAAIAPEIRFSFLNKKEVILYGALSGGVGFVDGYESRYDKYPKMVPYFQITWFGFSCNFGKNQNFFLGGEVGAGLKGLFNIHGGYRF